MFSFALARSCEDRSRSAMKCAQPTRAPEKSVHGRRRRGRSRCRLWDHMGVALGRVGDTEPFRISLTKKVVLSWLHCTCNRKNCHIGQNGCRR